MADNTENTTSNKTIADIDLRSRNHFYLKWVSFITAILLLILVGTSCAINAYIYNKVVMDHGNKTEKTISLATSILLAFTLVIIMMFFAWYVAFYLFPGVKQEDEFLTNIVRISTVPTSSADLKTSLHKYLTDKIPSYKGKSQDATNSLIGYMNGKYAATPEGQQAAYQQNHLIFRYPNSNGGNLVNFSDNSNWQANLPVDLYDESEA